MTLDPDAARVIELIAMLGRPPIETLAIDEARETACRAFATFSSPSPEIPGSQNLTATAPDGHTSPLRLYRGGAGPAPQPALVFLHGGGWILGDLETHDPLCRQIAKESGATVIAVQYRLAPEHRFPAAVEDALAATRSVLARARELGIDPARVAVGGDSAGGNLAAVVALALRGVSGPSPLAAQILVYPATDLALRHDSYRRNGAGYLLTTSAVRWYRDNYLGNPPRHEDWRASPLSAQTHAGLPPAFIVTAGYDVLCDEGIAYAEALQRAGTRVVHEHLPGQVHGFLTMGRLIAAAGPAISRVSAFLSAC
jgi:acetyl esterase